MEETPPIEPQVSLGAFKKVFELNKLLLESGRLQTRQELIFFILNQSIRYVAYNRALLFEAGRSTRCSGVSGNGVFDAKSPVITGRLSLVGALKDRKSFHLLDASSFAEGSDGGWESVQKDHAGSSILWCPIVWKDHLLGGLWLERWGGGGWSAADVELMKPLMSAYAAAWRPYLRAGGGDRRFARKKPVGILIAVVLVAVLALVRVPLRIVAPCEVVPKDPEVVAAPLDGVLDRVYVHPGDAIEKGQLLFSYDKEVPLQELEVARQQVRMIWSDLERARAEAFKNTESRQLVGLLETRLEQEQSRLELAEYHASQLEVRAKESAVAMMGDPGEWAGRPVALGEKVMQLIDPLQSKLMIWLPQDDKVNFDGKTRVRVILNARALETQYATLSYQAQHAEQSSEGYSAFRAEAEWEHAPDALQMGLKGHAVLYGERVSLAYWLFRRPLASLRCHIGF
jgi:hypothetical protein